MRSLLAFTVALHCSGSAAAQGGLRYRDVDRVVPDSEAEWVVPADFDGDGLVDLVRVTLGEAKILRGDPLGLFADDWEDAGAMRLEGVAVDWNGDGFLDFMAPAAPYANDGTGHFQSVPWTLGVPCTPAQVLGDVDGDGDVDLIHFYNSLCSPPARLYLNDGSGGFTDGTPGRLNTVGGSGSLADMDGDGDLDYFYRRLDSPGSIEVQFNDGTGAFTPGTLSPGGSDFHLLDVEGDGDLDYVITDQWTVYLNDGDANFSASSRLLPPSVSAFEEVLFDANGDGLPDMLLRGDTRTWRLFLNPGSLPLVEDPSFAGQPVPLNGLFPDYVAADLDGDGDEDLVQHQPRGSTLLLRRGVEVRLNNGSGQFLDVTSALETYDRRADDVDVGDLDADGDSDAVVALDGELLLFRNDGGGGFELAAGLPPTPATTVVLFDADGDGDLDIVASTRDEQLGPFLLLNDGTGAFADASTRIPATLAVRTLEAVDMDRDGDVDLFCLEDRLTSGLLWLRHFRNDGAGVFSEVFGFPTITRAEWMTLGDADGDNDLDVFVVGAGLEPDFLLLNDGSGGLVASPGALPGRPPGVDYVRATFIDVDGDTGVDLAIQGRRGLLADDVETILLRNTLAPGAQVVYEDASASLWPGSLKDAEVADMVPVDLDRDGDQDLVDAGGRFWSNEGLAGLELKAVFPPVGRADFRGSNDGLALADLDDDGDLDLWLTIQSRIYSSLESQLTNRSVPRIGRPLTLDLYGEPDRPWQLFASLKPDHLSTPLGIVRIDLASAVKVAGGVLDAKGRGSKTVQVPSSLSLAGAEAYWQALYFTPFALSNLERTTLVAF